MATDNIEFVNRDYGRCSKNSMARQIKTRKNSFSNIMSAFKKNISDKTVQVAQHIYDKKIEKTFNGTYDDFSVERKLENKSKSIARLEKIIKVLSGEYVPENYVSKRAIKIKDSMEKNIVCNADYMYSFNLDVDEQKKLLDDERGSFGVVDSNEYNNSDNEEQVISNIVVGMDDSVVPTENGNDVAVESEDVNLSSDSYEENKDLIVAPDLTKITDDNQEQAEIASENEDNNLSEAVAPEEESSISNPDLSNNDGDNQEQVEINLEDEESISSVGDVTEEESSISNPDLSNNDGDNQEQVEINLEDEENNLSEAVVPEDESSISNPDLSNNDDDNQEQVEINSEDEENNSSVGDVTINDGFVSDVNSLDSENSNDNTGANVLDIDLIKNVIGNGLVSVENSQINDQYIAPIKINDVEMNNENNPIDSESVIDTDQIKSEIDSALGFFTKSESSVAKSYKYDSDGNIKDNSDRFVPIVVDDTPRSFEKTDTVGDDINEDVFDDESVDEYVFDLNDSLVNDEVAKSVSDEEKEFMSLLNRYDNLRKEEESLEKAKEAARRKAEEVHKREEIAKASKHQSESKLKSKLSVLKEYLDEKEKNNDSIRRETEIIENDTNNIEDSILNLNKHEQDCQVFISRIDSIMGDSDSYGFVNSEENVIAKKHI